MKLKLLLSAILLPLIIFAQEDNTSQSIELPDFVITGVQTVNIPMAKKIKPQLVTMLSKEFITPIFSPEMFALSAISKPVVPNLELLAKRESINGQLRVGAGLYTLPQGELNIGKSFKHASLFGTVFGLNEREYIDNAGYNISGGSINSDFFVSNKSGFLPGLNVFFNLQYFRDSYKFYGSDSSDLERKTQTTNVAFGIKNTLNRNFKYGFKLSGNIFDIAENNFGESRLTADAFIDLMVSSFGIHSDAQFINQDLTNNPTGKTNYSYLSTDSRAVFQINSSVQLKAGINLAVYNGNSFFAPGGNATIKLNEAVTFIAEYSPGTKFFGAGEMKNQNRFAVFDSTDNIIEREKHKLKAAIRYQFLQYIEISGGASYSVFDNYVYYQDKKTPGLFDVENTDGVKSFSIFGNFMFHAGPFGYFYGEAVFRNVEDSDKNLLPYNPKLFSSLIYGYIFENGFTIKSKIDYHSAVYTDIQNSMELPPYFNLALMFEYELFSNLRLTFDLNNLINRKNYLWSGYQEKQLDFVAGVDYRW
jgi:hypothetical protein